MSEFTILLNGTSHALLVTHNSLLHQRDTGGEIEFLIPTTVAEGPVEPTVTVTAKYLTPGNVLYTQLLSVDSELYNNTHYRCTMTINTNFTGVAGLVNLQLSINNTNPTGVSTFAFNTDDIKIPIEKVEAGFSAAQDGGAVSNIAGMTLTGTSLSLLNTEGETVGSTIDLGALTSSIADKGNAEGGLLVVVDD